MLSTILGGVFATSAYAASYVSGPTSLTVSNGRSTNSCFFDFNGYILEGNVLDRGVFDLVEEVLVDGNGTVLSRQSGVLLQQSQSQPLGRSLELANGNYSTAGSLRVGYQDVGANSNNAFLGLTTVPLADMITQGGACEDIARSINGTTVTMNQAPTAEAGPNQTRNLGQTPLATLDAGSSTDPDPGDMLSYVWRQVSGPTVAVTGALTNQSITLSDPAQSGTAVFEVTVNDGNGGTDTDTVSVTFNATLVRLNRIPVAEAGPNQTRNLGQTPSVTLDAGGSTDADPGDTLSYVWRQVSGPTVVVTGALTNQSITLADPAQGGTVVFEVTVNDGNGGTDTDTVSVTFNTVATPLNRPPTANAGANRTRQIGQTPTLTLTGNASTDPDPNDTLTYRWVQLSGPSVTLTPVGGPRDVIQRDVFVRDPAQAGTVVIQLTVNDNNGGTDTDTVSITYTAARVVNTPPVANAGADRTLTALGNGDTLTLDGSNSSDPQGDALTYQWSVVSGSATLATPTAVRPVLTYTGDNTDGNSEEVVVQLIVNDGTVDSPANRVTLTFQDDLGPTANAGPDQALFGLDNGSTVTLDGSGSSDPENGPLTYQWSVVSGSASLADPTAAMPVLTYTGDGTDGAPEEVIVQLVVSDGRNDSAPDTVVLSLTDNLTPTAVAGDDQALFGLDNGDTVTLDGSASSDPEGASLSYAWRVVSGSATITNPTSVSPELVYTGSGTDLTNEEVVVELIVNDGFSNSAPDTLTVTFNDNRAPEAVATVASASANEGDVVTLTGSSSSDPDNDTLNYSWVQVSGPAVSLSDPNAANPTFVAPDISDATTLIFELTVDDGRNLSDTASVSVNLEPRGTITIVQRSQGGDSAFGFSSGLAALNITITTTNGTGQISSGEVAQGQYVVTAADTRAAGFALTGLICSDGSEVDVDARTATITLAPGEDVICTFTSVNSRAAAKTVIRDMVTQRSALILSNGPDRQRRLDRLAGRSGGKAGSLKVAGITLPGSGLLVGVMGSVDKFESGDDTPASISTEGDGYLVGPYATARITDSLYFDGRVMFGSSDNTIAPLGTFKDDFDTSRLLFAASLSGDFNWSEQVSFRPAVELRHLRETQKAYTDSLGVQIDEEKFGLGEISFAPRLERTVALNNGWVMRPFGQVEGIYAYGDNAEVVLGSSLRARVEGGITLRSEGGVSAGISGFADGIGSENYDAQGLRFKLSYTIK